MITLILRQHSVCSIFWWMEVTKNIRRHDYNRWGWILFVKQKRCSIEEGEASGNNVDQKFTGFLLVSKKQHYFHISWNISLYKKSKMECERYHTNNQCYVELFWFNYYKCFSFLLNPFDVKVDISFRGNHPSKCPSLSSEEDDKN